MKLKIFHAEFRPDDKYGLGQIEIDVNSWIVSQDDMNIVKTETSINSVSDPNDSACQQTIIISVWHEKQLINPLNLKTS